MAAHHWFSLRVSASLNVWSLRVASTAVLALFAVVPIACSSSPQTADNSAPADSPGVVQLDPPPRNDQPGKFRHLVRNVSEQTPIADLVKWGDQAFDGGDLPSAAHLLIEAFDRGAFSTTPIAVADGAFRIGWCLQQFDPARAISYYDICIENKPDHWDAYFNRANCYLALNRIRDFIFADQEGTVITRHGAMHFYNELIAKQQQAGIQPYAYAFFNRGYCFYLAGRLPQSRTDFIRFYESGGSETPFAERALQWIALLEEKMVVAPHRRYTAQQPQQ